MKGVMWDSQEEAPLSGEALRDKPAWCVGRATWKSVWLNQSGGGAGKK